MGCPYGQICSTSLCPFAFKNETKSKKAEPQKEKKIDLLREAAAGD
jgi:hypothetical protein